MIDVPSTALAANIPSPLAESSASALEWPRLRDYLSTRTFSPLGKAWVLALEPSSDLAWIEAQHQRTEEMRALYNSGGSFDFHGLFDPTPLLEKARIEGSALEPLEILSLITVVERIAVWRNLLLDQSQNWVPHLREAKVGSQDDRAAANGIAALSIPIRDSDLQPLLRHLHGKIEPDGSLSDDASPELRRIRRAMEQQHRTIEESLRRAMNRLTAEGSTQDAVITIRGDRFVIPVRAEFKRKVPGVVHGSSSSGQTVFVEPLETIEQNNELVRLLDEEQSEIHRILVAMTRALAADAPTILTGAAILAEIESHAARARFANDLRCTRPIFTSISSGKGVISTEAQRSGEIRFSTDAATPTTDRVPPPSHREGRDVETTTPPTNVISTGAQRSGETRFSTDATTPTTDRVPHLRDEVAKVGSQDATGDQPHLSLTNARHPLLELRMIAEARATGDEPKHPIPLTVELRSDARQLIISGPNTGGKTVSLKTIGLLALMAQAGVPIPAEEATLPLFTSIFADIGDAQSIERNLSSFSAHVVNLDRISREATSSSLVLLDELGSATDPEEGAALAVAVSQHFLRARVWSCITTHLTSLKVYAANNAGVLNAAVGFDQETLTPTYQLRLGVPGASAGLNIAARLGLSPEIITAARSQLSTQTADIAAFLDRLHQQLAAVTEERETLKQREQELQKEMIRLDLEGRAEIKQRTRELERKLESLINDFEYQLRESVKAIDDKAVAKKIQRDSATTLARARREFGQQFKSTVVAHMTGADKDDPNAQPHIVKGANVGDLVKLKSLGRQARVERVIDSKTYEVSIGPMKMKVPIDDIAEIEQVKVVTPLEAARKRGGVTVFTAEDPDYMSSEINVIGRTADEAHDEVARFVDRAFLAGLPRIRIVHGTGMGILRRTLREYLRSHPHVANITEPPQNQGGQGATEVELRQ